MSFPKISGMWFSCILLDLNIFDLPESVPYFLKYLISAVHVFKITRYTSFDGCAFVDTPQFT